ncbi:MAG: hypothetical protein WBA93_27960 [Microcoleaceae cyanobacterium]
MVFNAVLTALDYALLGLHWVKLSAETVVIVGCDGEPLGVDRIDYLLDNAWDKIADASAAKGYSQVLLYGTDGRQYKISANLSGGSQSLPPQVSSESSKLLINVPEPLITLQLLEDSDLPTYINAISTQKKLYANPTALNAQGQPPEMFLQGNAYDLNDVEELDYRTSRIANGEKLTEYAYQAWRWFFDTEAGRFRLKRMQFHSNFKQIQFCGQSCWLGQVLEAVEIGGTRL